MSPTRCRRGRGRAGALVAGGALALLVSSGACIESSRKPLHPFFAQVPHPLILAHRGGGGERPESTALTFARTAAVDPEAVVEFDVHRTSDGDLVVIHDDDIDRVVGEGGQSRERPVGSLTLEALQAFDAAHCFSPLDGGTATPRDCADPELDLCERFPFRFLRGPKAGLGLPDPDPAKQVPCTAEKYDIPTLDEALAKIPPRTLISVEVKDTGIERDVAAVLKSGLHDLDRMLVGSIDDESAHILRHELPGVPSYVAARSAACFVLSSKTGSYWPSCPDGDVLAVPPEQSGLDLTSLSFIDDAHHRGLAVFFWTINDPATIERLLRAGADGIITDFPDRATQQLAELRAAGALPPMQESP